MKKIALILSLTVSISFIAKSQTTLSMGPGWHPASDYEIGYINGYNLGYSMVEQIVATHPSYGAQGSGEFPAAVTPIGTAYGSGYTSSNSTVNDIINGSYDFSTSYNAAIAGEMAINDLWATGAFEYLLQNSSQGDYNLGLYHGYLEGTARWVYDHL